MSEVKVNKISPRSGTDVTLGDSGDTFTIPSGATINNQGTATNFGATGSASWTTTVKTSTFTAVAGEGYFVNTTGGVITVNLPAGTAGAVVAVKDYAGTFDTNNVTLVQNGSDKIGGSTDNKLLSTEGIAATLIFIDSTQGWLVTDDGLQSTAAAPTYDIDFLVIAGGGGGGSAGGSEGGGGGGAGGLRTSTQTSNTGVSITVTVGDGGAGGDNDNPGVVGNASSISGSGLTTISSAGGGYGAVDGGGGVGSIGGNGGSGGGSSAYYTAAGGSGNTPSTSPSQGNNGGIGHGSPSYGGGGGGGHSAVGANAIGGLGGNGGAGTDNSITGSTIGYAGGGGGGTHPAEPAGTATDGGGAGGRNTVGSNGTVNLGGGGGGAGGVTSNEGGNGGKGVVILSMLDAKYSGTTTGSPTVATGVSGKTVLTFTGSGSYTT